MLMNKAISPIIFMALFILGQFTVTSAAFIEQPFSTLKEIYQDYHNGNVDNGITKANNALNDINPLYQKNRNTVLNAPELRLNKVYQVKSVLHTLLGMLYSRKMHLTLNPSSNNGLSKALEKVDTGLSLNETDFESIIQEHEKTKPQTNLTAKAVEQFNLGINTDKKNPSPHFQLAELYRQSAQDQTTNKKIEQQYFLAAHLSLAEEDINAAQRAYNALQAFNPSSPFLRRIHLPKS